jgi:hypothetical protein
MALPQRAAIALWSILAGAAGGAAIGTIGTWCANWMVMNGFMKFGDPRNTYFAGVGLGIVVALALGWTLSAGVGETWRRAAIAVTAFFGAIAGSGGAYLIGVFSLMAMSMTAQYYLPAYLALMIVIFVVAFRMAARRRRNLGAPVTA